MWLVKDTKYAIRFGVDIAELAFKLLCMIDVDQYIEQDKDFKRGDLALVAEITAIEYAKVVGIDDVSLAVQHLHNAAQELLDAHVWVENDLTTGKGFIKFIGSYNFYDEDEKSLVQIRLSEPGQSWLSFNKDWFYGQYIELASARLIYTTPIINNLFGDCD